MIGRLSGKVVEKYADKLIIDVQGVGYLVWCPKREIEKINSEQSVVLQIHTHVKEENLDLYGFISITDLKVFKSLITVSGVGPKLALTVLSDYSSNSIVEAISKADTSFFQSISGIGKKNAQKIIVELKSKFGSAKELDLSSELDTQNELLEAMQSLGYKINEINPLIKKIPSGVNKLEDQVKYLLKQLR